MAPDLGLDLKLSTTKFITTLSKEASLIQDNNKRISKLEESIKTLEIERKRIEVFKRELPLCMFLLNDVIDGVRDEVEQCRGCKLEEEGGIKSENDCNDKMNWMSSAQLWSDNYSEDVKDHNTNIKKNTESADESNNSQVSKSTGGAFVPFKATRVKEEGKFTREVLDLPFVARPAVYVVPDHRPVVCQISEQVAGCHVSPVGSNHLSIQSQQQDGPRKTRRCWSPELHRRFVSALLQLGGARVATPKQIRELMKEDGLTNDEVKSHLQKYRLYARRAPNSSSSANLPVMMGGFRVPQEHCKTSQQSASPQGPLHSVTPGDSCEEDGKSESCNLR